MKTASEAYQEATEIEESNRRVNALTTQQLQKAIHDHPAFGVAFKNAVLDDIHEQIEIAISRGLTEASFHTHVEMQPTGLESLAKAAGRAEGIADQLRSYGYYVTVNPPYGVTGASCTGMICWKKSEGAHA